MRKLKNTFPFREPNTLLKKELILFRLVLFIFFATFLNVYAVKDPIKDGLRSEDSENLSAGIYLQQGVQRKVTGTVTDENGQPVPGVTISVKGTTVGALTDFNGKYEVNVPDKAELLVFSFVGMKPQEIPIGSSSVINVVLQEEVFGLDEVVVLRSGSGEQVQSTTTVPYMLLMVSLAASAV